MSNLIVPAPLWRRLCAAVYDGLVLLGLWLAALLIEMIVRENLLGLPRHDVWLQLYLFGTGLVFFGWFWIHGGQTLGMRAWKLQVRRLDGAALRWPVCAVRYSVMIVTWMAVLAPSLLGLPHFAAMALVQPVALVGALLALAAGALMLIEARRRAPCDWAAGTEVVVVPKPN